MIARSSSGSPAEGGRVAEYLDLADYVLIVEAVLGVAAEEIARRPGIGVAESRFMRRRQGLLAWSWTRTRSTRRRCCAPDSRGIIRSRTARNGIEWVPPSADETVAMIERVAAGEVSEHTLADWLRTTSREL